MMTEDTQAQPYTDAAILYVSLNDGKTKREQVPDELYKNYLGGRGLGVKMLYDNLQPGIDPLSPENLLIFAIGPSTATTVPTAGRFAVITKSPQTGTIFDSSCGGYFGAQLRRAGYAAIVLEGKSDKPVYLLIEDKRVEIRDASDIWGKDIYEVTDLLKKRVGGGREVKVLAIGQAGENLVRYAAIINDKRSVLGRCGGLKCVYP